MNTSTQTGRLNVIDRVIASIGDDLMVGTDAERDISALLHAVHAAIVLDATGELRELVKPWLDDRLVEMVRAQGIDDQAREDALVGLRVCEQGLENRCPAR